MRGATASSISEETNIGSVRKNKEIPIVLDLDQMDDSRHSLSPMSDLANVSRNMFKLKNAGLGDTTKYDWYFRRLVLLSAEAVEDRVFTFELEDAGFQSQSDERPPIVAFFRIEHFFDEIEHGLGLLRVRLYARKVANGSFEALRANQHYREKRWVSEAGFRLGAGTPHSWVLESRSAPLCGDYSLNEEPLFYLENTEENFEIEAELAGSLKTFDLVRVDGEPLTKNNKEAVIKRLILKKVLPEDQGIGGERTLCKHRYRVEKVETRG